MDRAAHQGGRRRADRRRRRRRRVGAGQPAGGSGGPAGAGRRRATGPVRIDPGHHRGGAGRPHLHERPHRDHRQLGAPRRPRHRWSARRSRRCPGAHRRRRLPGLGLGRRTRGHGRRAARTWARARWCSTTCPTTRSCTATRPAWCGPYDAVTGACVVRGGRSRARALGRATARATSRRLTPAPTARTASDTWVVPPARVTAPERIFLGDDVTILEHAFLSVVGRRPRHRPDASHRRPHAHRPVRAHRLRGRVEIGPDVLTSDRVFIGDTYHGYEDPALPVVAQPHGHAPAGAHRAGRVPGHRQRGADGRHDRRARLRGCGRRRHRGRGASHGRGRQPGARHPTVGRRRPPPGWTCPASASSSAVRRDGGLGRPAPCRE